MPQPRRGKTGRAVHLTYQVDLQDPTKASLEQIRNTVIEKITRSVQEELESPAEETTHDRHTSVHSKDKGIEIRGVAEFRDIPIERPGP